MKKIFLILLSLVVICLVGCGDSSEIEYTPFEESKVVDEIVQEVNECDVIFKISSTESYSKKIFVGDTLLGYYPTVVNENGMVVGYSSEKGGAEFQGTVSSEQTFYPIYKNYGIVSVYKNHQINNEINYGKDNPVYINGDSGVKFWMLDCSNINDVPVYAEVVNGQNGSSTDYYGLFIIQQSADIVYFKGDGVTRNKINIKIEKRDTPLKIVLDNVNLVGMPNNDQTIIDSKEFDSSELIIDLIGNNTIEYTAKATCAINACNCKLTIEGRDDKSSLIISFTDPDSTAKLEKGAIIAKELSVNNTSLNVFGADGANGTDGSDVTGLIKLTINLYTGLSFKEISSISNKQFDIDNAKGGVDGQNGQAALYVQNKLFLINCVANLIGGDGGNGGNGGSIKVSIDMSQWYNYWSIVQEAIKTTIDVGYRDVEMSDVYYAAYEDFVKCFYKNGGSGGNGGNGGEAIKTNPNLIIYVSKKDVSILGNGGKCGVGGAYGTAFKTNMLFLDGLDGVDGVKGVDGRKGKDFSWKNYGYRGIKDNQLNTQNLVAAKTEVTYNGHTYKLINEALTWKEAKVRAEELGGHLVTITSKAENEVVKKLFKDSGLIGVWLGATDSPSEGATEGNWQWITGEPFDYLNWGQITTNSGEPNGGSNENYLEYYSGYINGLAWNDAPGTNTFAFILELE